jgi:hypothetical protein
MLSSPFPTIVTGSARRQGSAGRRQYGAVVDLPDRTAVKPCQTCGELTGRGYPSCLGCAEAVDQRWLEDWQDLLAASRASAGAETEQELATQVLSADPDAYPWTCKDWALRLRRCADCGGELGAGDPVCLLCAAADSARWSSWAGADHPLRMAALGLRAPQRRRVAVVSTLRLVLPFVLAGEPMTTQQLRAVRDAVLAGRYSELAALDRLASLAHFSLLPWRRPGSVS